tara:strand:+ start:90 stop:332 length:243 start_codon:yes stop_codon:yes gene_type:complete
MQSKNPFLNDISNLMTNAFSVAQSAKSEMETLFNSKVDDWLSRRDFVNREEFDVLKLRVDKLIEENNKLLSELENLKNKK